MRRKKKLSKDFLNIFEADLLIIHVLRNEAKHIIIIIFHSDFHEYHVNLIYSSKVDSGYRRCT